MTEAKQPGDEMSPGRQTGGEVLVLKHRGAKHPEPVFVILKNDKKAQNVYFTPFHLFFVLSKYLTFFNLNCIIKRSIVSGNFRKSFAFLSKS